jgi:hypothetical protein
VFSNVDPGNYCVRVRVVNNAGNPSDWAGPVQHTVEAGTPNPPTIQTVETTAYVLTDNGKLVRVGSVPLGTGCINGPLYQRGWRVYYEVPREAVTFSKDEPGTTVAVCNQTLEVRG